jgi:hypothetical protein
MPYEEEDTFLLVSCLVDAHDKCQKRPITVSKETYYSIKRRDCLLVSCLVDAYIYT